MIDRLLSGIGVHSGRWHRLSRIVNMVALVLLVMAGATTTTVRAESDNGAVVALRGYQVSVFARGSASTTNPDSITVDAQHVYVAYQNATKADGSDGGSSTIVQYMDDGKEVRSFSVKGRCDGLRLDSATHLLWALVNEDANSLLYTINPKTGEIKTYHYSSAPHGGGYDDAAFTHGMAFITASNPTLNSAGVNTAPAVDKVVLQGDTAMLTPVLQGNATALDTTTNTQVTLNEVDPDSLTVDPKGDVVLVNQAGAEVVTIQNPGTPQQTVTRIPTGTQLDDTVWAKQSAGRLFVVDATQNTVYVLHTEFKPGTVYTEAPNDSGVASFVGTLDLKTGTVIPIAIGFGKPTGLLFVPDGGDREGDN